MRPDVPPHGAQSAPWGTRRSGATSAERGPHRACCARWGAIPEVFERGATQPDPGPPTRQPRWGGEGMHRRPNANELLRRDTSCQERSTMFITRKHIPRRTFLRGAGTMLALPLLDAMVPARTLLAQTAASPRTRFTGIFVPHGMAPGYWVPAKEGAGFELPMILSPLEPFRDRTVVLSGLWSKSAEPPPGVTGADHWVAAAYLCANKPKKTAGADIYDGTTIDQIIAETIGQETLLPSIQLGVEDPGANSSNCGEGYSCAYTNSISWATPTRPLPMEINPQVTA